MQGKRNSRRSKQRKRCRKNNNRFKKLKLKREREKKENYTELQKSNIETEIYNNIKKCDWGKTKLKSLIKFHSANKIDSYSRGEKKGENPKESTEQVKT